MAQSDQTVQNASFPTVRADINDNLAALFSQSSGNSAPSTTVAFQPWIDTSTSPPTWKVRNASNSAWITIGTLDPAGFNVSGTVAIANGGTGQTTATSALAALLPSQTGNSGKALVTNGSAASWGTINSNSDKQVFTADGTWTKPSFGTVALIQVWGGGGGGARSSATALRAGGGGGGGFSERWIQLSSLPATVSVSVGTGGTGAATTATNGLAGNDTYFGSSISTAYAAAEGGYGGRYATSTTSSANGGAGGGVFVTNGSNSLFSVSSLSGASQGSGGDAHYGGAGGGGYDFGINITYSGGESFYGGGGGGAVNGATTTSAKGYSANGGNGGDGSTGAGAAGSVPGGGGGGGNNSGGNGGAGLCIVYVW